MQNRFSDKAFFAIGSTLLLTSNLSFYQLLKNITKFQVVVLGPWPMTLAWISFHKIKGFVFEECFKNHPYTCLWSSLFFISWKHTEFLVIFFNRTENRLSKLVRETIVWSLWKKSRLFYTHNNFQKNYSFNASRIEKIHWNVVKITFSCGNYHILTFFSCCLTELWTKDHRAQSPFL